MGPTAAVAAVRRAVRDALSGRSGPVLVACSGGADSTALAAATAFVAARRGLAAGLVTVDHGLQPGSAQRAAAVGDLGHRLGLDPVRVLPVSVGSDGGPEAAARTARLRALGVAAAALDAGVLLGHTLDDQAETVLLGLGRGSGLRSIAGMTPADGRWLRPLLGLRGSTTRQACLDEGLEFWDDPHNADPRFQRARLRTEVLPLLEDVLQGGVAPALARTADLLRDAQDAVDAWVTRELHGRGTAAGLAVQGLAALPRAVRTGVLRRWAERLGAGPLTYAHTAALDALVLTWHGQGPVHLPGGIAVRRASGRLEPVPPPAPPQAGVT